MALSSSSTGRRWKSTRRQHHGLMPRAPRSTAHPIGCSGSYDLSIDQPRHERVQFCAREADRSANVHRFDLALADESVQCCAADAEQVSSLLSGERRRDSASCSDCLRRLASGSWVLRYIVKKLAGEGRGHPDAGYLKERAEDWVPAQYNAQSYKEKRRHYFIEG
jgi:hypothetical protein